MNNFRPCAHNLTMRRAIPRSSFRPRSPRLTRRTPPWLRTSAPIKRNSARLAPHCRSPDQAVDAWLKADAVRFPHALARPGVKEESERGISYCLLFNLPAESSVLCPRDSVRVNSIPDHHFKIPYV